MAEWLQYGKKGYLKGSGEFSTRNFTGTYETIGSASWRFFLQSKKAPIKHTIDIFLKKGQLVTNCNIDISEIKELIKCT